MRKVALVLSLVAGVMSGWLALGLIGSGLSLAIFGGSRVCAAGGPECHYSANEPGDFIALLPFVVPFGGIAIGSIAGGIVTLSRPRAGAVLLFATAALGIASILFLVVPFWTPFDFAAGILAIIAARQSSPVAEPGPTPP